MNTNEYRRNVYKTLSIKPAKAGIRQMLRKRTTLNVSHAIVGFSAAVGRMRQGLVHYVTGESQLKDEMRGAARVELGWVFYYASVLSKELKVKLPGAGKKTKLAGTLTTNIMLLDGLAIEMLDAHLGVYSTGEPVNVEQLHDRFKLAVPYIYGITYALFGEPPLQILAENFEVLKARFPAGHFDPQPKTEAKPGEKKPVPKGFQKGHKSTKTESTKVAA